MNQLILLLNSWTGNYLFRKYLKSQIEKKVLSLNPNQLEKVISTMRRWYLNGTINNPRLGKVSSSRDIIRELPKIIYVDILYNNIGIGINKIFKEYFSI